MTVTDQYPFTAIRWGSHGKTSVFRSSGMDVGGFQLGCMAFWWVSKTREDVEERICFVIKDQDLKVGASGVTLLGREICLSRSLGKKLGESWTRRSISLPVRKRAASGGARRRAACLPLQQTRLGGRAQGTEFRKTGGDVCCCCSAGAGASFAAVHWFLANSFVCPWSL